jgi:hypothetical protein
MNERKCLTLYYITYVAGRAPLNNLKMKLSSPLIQHRHDVQVVGPGAAAV